MNELDMKHLFEAAILAAGRPITTQQLAELFDERERPSLEQVLNALNALREDYANRGIELLEVSSGWRVQVRGTCVDFVSRLWQERPARYSRAMLETLALIAYRQPITRGEIEEIRGVAVSSTIMRTMYERNWIRVVGHREVPGRPEVLATTKEFLDYFGLKSLDQLPTLAELKDLETIGVQLEFNTAEVTSEGDSAGTANEEMAGDISVSDVATAVADEGSATDLDASTTEAEFAPEAGVTNAAELEPLATQIEAVAEDAETAESADVDVDVDEDAEESETTTQAH